MTQHYGPPAEGKDPQIWELAQQRVAFKRHLRIYLVINLMLWGLWLLYSDRQRNGFPWPAWVTFGWGIGLGSHYFSAFHDNGRSAVEREYQKLSNKQ